MDSGNRAGFNAESVIQQLNYWNDAVSGAGSVGDNAVSLFKSLFVNAEHYRSVEIAAAGMGKQHFLRARLQMGFAIGAAAPNAGAVQHDVDVQFAPRQIGDPRLMQQTNGIVADP